MTDRTRSGEGGGDLCWALGLFVLCSAHRAAVVALARHRELHPAETHPNKTPFKTGRRTRTPAPPINRAASPRSAERASILWFAPFSLPPNQSEIPSFLRLPTQKFQEVTHADQRSPGAQHTGFFLSKMRAAPQERSRPTDFPLLIRNQKLTDGNFWHRRKMLDGSSARPTMRRWALLLTGVLCACGMVALLAVAVAPARAEAGSVALGEIFPGPSVFAGENRGRRAARASLEEGQSEDAAQDGAVPSDESAEEPETGAAPAGGDSTEEEAGAGEADAEAAPAKEEETEEAATAEEGEKDEAAPANEGENEEAAPAEEEEQQLAPGEEVGQQLGHRKKQARSDASAESADSAEEEKEDDSKPSDFLKGMVRRVAREVLPAAARAKLRDSSDHVEAANVQLASARKLQRDSRKEEHKAMYAAYLPHLSSPQPHLAWSLLPTLESAPRSERGALSGRACLPSAAFRAHASKQKIPVLIRPHLSTRASTLQAEGKPSPTRASIAES